MFKSKKKIDPVEAAYQKQYDRENVQWKAREAVEPLWTLIKDLDKEVRKQAIEDLSRINYIYTSPKAARYNGMIN